MIPYGRQSINEEDIQAVVEILRSSFLTQGPLVSQFEEGIASYCGSTNALATCNATAALHLACLALDVGPGDRVWTSPNTFVASANCALYCGAEVDFVDIDLATYNLDSKALAAKLATAAEQGKLPKVLIPVHFAGQSCEMSEIKRLSEQYGFAIIEDASHAIGGAYREAKVGSCQYADITVFSFHPVKIITTGEGGVLTTNNARLASRLRKLRSHGITRDSSIMVSPNENPWYYEQVELGFNYRITDIQCALGLSQLKRLDQFVARRRELVEVYNQALHDLPVILPYERPNTYSSYHLYVIRIDPSFQKKSHAQIFAELRQAGIGVNLHYIPVYTQPYYQKLGFNWGYCPVAENYYQSAITLPLFPEMTAQEQNHVVQSLSKILA